MGETLPDDLTALPESLEPIGDEILAKKHTDIDDEIRVKQERDRMKKKWAHPPDAMRTEKEVFADNSPPKPEPNALERQEGGDHYKNMKIQPAEFIQRNELNFCEGNTVKLVCRHHEKNGAEDIRKAIHYLEMLLEMEYGAS